MIGLASRVKRLVVSERESSVLMRNNRGVGMWAWGGKREDLCLIAVFCVKSEVMLCAGSEGRGVRIVSEGSSEIAILRSGQESTGEKENRIAGCIESPLEV